MCKALKSVLSRPESNNFAPAVQLLSKFTSGKKKDLFHSGIGHHLETSKYEERNKITKAEKSKRDGSLVYIQSHR